MNPCMHERGRLARAAGWIVVSGMLATAAIAGDRLSPRKLKKYVDPLPIPQVMPAAGVMNGANYYEIGMTEFSQKLHRDLPATRVWGYGPPDGQGGYLGTYPARTIEVRTRERIHVLWTSQLPDRHLLPVDKTVHGADGETPEVRTVVHVHGARVASHSDGYPEAWFTRGFEHTGPAFQQRIYTYTNRQPAATLWYHDHALGITRLNVYAGLAGFYLIRSAEEERLNLPSGAHEVPIVIQDRSFYRDGSLYYPADEINGVPNSIVPEFFGDTILANGKIWPYLEVEPRKYRFRLLNGCNARFLILRLSNDGTFYQIGTDGGLLERPVPRTEILLAPAERADVVVDFTGLPEGTQVLLNNLGPDGPFKGPGIDPPADPDTTGQVMLFRVGRISGPDTSVLPAVLTTIARYSEGSARRVRDMTLEEHEDEYGRLMLMLNGMHWSDPITENPQRGSIEVWRLINLTEDVHPIHLHLVQFQILDRQPFDVERYTETGELVFTGDPVPPDANEDGWKDTVRANAGEVARVIARFDLAGLYVWHCHILEHEDHEMMRPYRVVPGAAGKSREGQLP